MGLTEVMNQRPQQREEEVPEVHRQPPVYHQQASAVETLVEWRYAGLRHPGEVEAQVEHLQPSPSSQATKVSSYREEGAVDYPTC